MARDELLDPNPNLDEQVEAPLTGRRARPGSSSDIDISVDMSMDASTDTDASTDAGSGDTDIGLDDNGLRPKTLEDFVGQAELKERLSIILEAARGRQQAADHLLFAGPPGLGKTTLAGIVANELNAQLQITSGPAIERAGDLASILTNLEPGGVLFIDEIHRLPRVVEEVLYPAMEDLQIDVIVGKGPVARSIRFDLEPFTLVGATTRTGLITGPLRDRFGFDFRLDFYDVADLERIVLRAGAVMGIDVEPDGAAEIAGRSRGTPRIANRLLRRVRDYSEVRGHGVINRETAADGLALFGVDERGLGKVDRTLLSNLCERFSGGPVGLSTLAISVAEPTETVEDVIEPFLIQQGLLIRTPRGRVATAAAWRHIGLEAPDESLVTPDVTTLFD